VAELDRGSRAERSRTEDNLLFTSEGAAAETGMARNRDRDEWLAKRRRRSTSDPAVGELSLQSVPRT